jgi:hypothetical protein
MTQVIGPTSPGHHYLTKIINTVVNCPECGDTHEHQKVAFDDDAYWNLDWQGEPAVMDEPMNLYAKAWFPRLRDAQLRFTTDRLARQQENRLRRPQ